MVQMTLEAFARHLATTAADMPVLERRGLDEAGKMLQREARGYIGEYQDAVGPFPAWEPLAHSTLYGGVAANGYRFKGKIELGYSPPDNPLLREGDLRDSIGYTVRGRQLLLGSTSIIARYQELGTRTIPPRSFIGRAMAAKGRDASRMVMERLMRPLLTGRRWG